MPTLTAEAGQRRRGFDSTKPPIDRAKNRSLFFNDMPLTPV